jgi:hypothetical protein
MGGIAVSHPQPRPGPAFADASVLEKGFFQGLNLPMQQMGGLMKETAESIGHDG